MTEQTPGRRPTTTEQILDLLLDALAERQNARARVGPTHSASPTVASEEKHGAPTVPPTTSVGRSPSPLPPRTGEDKRPSPSATPAREGDAQKRPTMPEVVQRGLAPPPDIPPRPGEEGWQPGARLPSIQMGKFLGRLAIAVALLVVVINIPVKSHGVSLARILPDSASLIIRDGLVLKGSGEGIYMLQDERLRWISSMDVFEHLGLTWGDVHQVDDAFLEQFEMGHPIYLILKCDGSPHIYALENGQKRWIRDIDTFASEGYVWEDVQLVDCNYLRRLPDGLPIPEDAGAPPQP